MSAHIFSAPPVRAGNISDSFYKSQRNHQQKQDINLPHMNLQFEGRKEER
jgi:hypothetical protein